MSASFANALATGIALISGCACVCAFPPEVENEVRMDFAVKRYLQETRPWWTCEYTAHILPRERGFLVRRIVLAGKEKCSRSHRDERFDVVYDPERDKIVQVRKSKVSDLTNRWSQPLAVAMRRFDVLKQFREFATLAAASGGSATSR
jgi:hypothetical protein